MLGKTQLLIQHPISYLKSGILDGLTVSGSSHLPFKVYKALVSKG